MAGSRTRRSSTSTTAGSSSTRTGWTTPTRTMGLPRRFFRSLSRGEHKRYPDGYLLSYSVRIDRIHPPSILPISSIIVSRAIYFLLSSALASFISRTNTRSILSFRLACSRVGSLAAFCCPLASIMPSITSSAVVSTRSKIENLSCLGISRRNPCSILYSSYVFLKIGMSKLFI